MSSGNRSSTDRPRDPDLAGAEAAMHRAAGEARRRAEEVTGAGAWEQTKPGERPMVVPAFAEEEGHTVVDSLKTLHEAGLRGSTEHLRNACDLINKGDWTGSIRESLHTVESVARVLVPEANTLEPALASIEGDGGLHPALKGALSKLYGYTSNEQGLRHPLLDNDKAEVGMDEALFMLGVCASFTSYLWRKHKARHPG